MKKGDIIDGVIEEVRFPNRGIFHTDDGIVEVKNVIPGQKVRVRITRKRDKRAESILLEILERAPDEVAAPCPQFGRCGGCTYLNMSYDRQLTLKQIQVMKLLQQGLDEGRRKLEASANHDSYLVFKDSDAWMNVFSWYEGIHSSPRIFGYRNKMEFTFGDEIKGGSMTLGMHKRGSFHDIVNADACVIADNDFQQIVHATRDFFSERHIPFYHRYQQMGYLRHLLVRKGAHTGEILIDLVTTSQCPSPAQNPGSTHDPTHAQSPAQSPGAAKTEFYDKLTETELLRDYVSVLNTLPLEGDIAGILHTRNDSLADVVEDQGTEVLYGKADFEENILGLQFTVTPFSFFQTNSFGAETLYTIVRQYIQEVVPPVDPSSGDSEDISNTKPVIYDLYCGTGTISQLVAPTARKVIGVEIVEEAVAAARENARRNHVDNCEFIAGDVLKTLDIIEEKPDLIILDPPRDGIHPKALPKILNYGVDYILYISCKPTSLSRDLPSFIAAGYRPVAGCSVDQFAWTGNVETVVCLNKQVLPVHLAGSEVRRDVL